MKKIVIIGCPGSGKSTFANKLHDITSLPIYHLDMMFWNSDRTAVSEDIFVQRIKSKIALDSWIIDGNYNSTIEMRLQACDTVFFLDYTLDVCLDGINTRKGKKRNDMPWVDAINEENIELLKFVKSYNDKSKPAIINLLNKYSDKNTIIFKNRREADLFLSTFNG